MLGIESLQAAFRQGTLLAPTSTAPNLVDLARAVAGLAGVPGAKRTAVSADLAQAIGQHDHLVFILADGLGIDLMEHLPPSSFLRTHLALPMRTVFPSTTAVALTSIVTASWPVDHGVTGWWTHVPEIGKAAAILPFALRSNGKPLSTAGVTPAQVFRRAPWMGLTDRNALCLFPSALASSVYTTFFAGGCPGLGYANLEGAVNTLIERIRTASSPTYTYLYYMQLDTAAHRYGVGHQEAQRTLELLEEEMARLSDGLRGRARIVLTGDHGFLDIPPSGRYAIKLNDRLLDLLRFPPSGDVRALYFHAREGLEQGVSVALEERFGERFLIFPVEDALRAGLLGPGAASPAVRERLGDVMAVSMGADALEYRIDLGPGRLAAYASHHSGLSPQEMRIPLILA